ncbi:cleavage and polyadenylation specificity factor subunit 6-like [Macadamia integrifolia]|uniref:cleavage and polyadenylation specificity factor subunit 6-like n=1 Tax=Macadamia integrifolia TaxID=60698 RepID=UPI001C4F231E|nr:cleavage and polyadenylation specificity factor subunit 6-like [Macadamia integrifolia]XP_042498718.1 cleavage and polyadenylation specificity factor subunit 6-like [Macadamia integrifolia]XP_042498719.1 cleavage and polyadenylation specificity factor subunit 6-like [Macadamia integrifolia]XP_042498720.1 cleavage and polyadenylation specificity factor subunit 6-like [Macadamia integrifolia]XP_042498721.1 cleavage and polyadenylation specificity factor subunit 6-like [Macadamia integrifolia]
MDPMAEEQLDYGDEEYGGQKLQYQGSGAIPALAEEEMMGEEDEYDDLYNDVNVGDGFLQLHRTEIPVLGGAGSGPQSQKPDVSGSRVTEQGVFENVTIPGVRLEGKDSTMGASLLEQKKGVFMSGKGLEGASGDYPDRLSQKERVMDMGSDVQVGRSGFGQSAAMPAKVGVDPSRVPVKFSGGSLSLPDVGIGASQMPGGSSSLPDAGIGAPQMPAHRIGMNISMNRQVMNENPIRQPVENGSTMLFVSELHWWTTDAELESMLSQFGRVKEIKFFDERASGKSKGYCQVEFFDPAAAAACKEGMNGYVFNGRACAVNVATSQTLKQIGAAYMNKNQVQTQSPSQGRRLVNDGVGRGGGMNFPAGEAGRSYGKVGWGRGGQGVLNRGPGGGGPMRGRGAIGAKNMVGGTGGVGTSASGGPYGQGHASPALGAPAGGMIHPQNMMGTGFDPTYMGRGGAYGGFSGPAFPGMIPSFPAVNTMALPGVAPHVNPAFFGHGMAANGMGMMGTSGMDVQHTGMWTDTNMGGWGGDDHGRRTREPSYSGDDGASNYGYGEASHERGGGGRSNAAPWEKDRGSERDWSGNSDSRHHDERDQDRDRSDKDHRYKEEKDGYRDHRQRERDYYNEDNWDRGQNSSRSRSKSRMMQEEDHRSQTRDAYYGKRRRLPSE